MSESTTLTARELVAKLASLGVPLRAGELSGVIFVPPGSNRTSFALRRHETALLLAEVRAREAEILPLLTLDSCSHGVRLDEKALVCFSCSRRMKPAP